MVTQNYRSKGKPMIAESPIIGHFTPTPQLQVSCYSVSPCAGSNVASLRRLAPVLITPMGAVLASKIAQRRLDFLFVTEYLAAGSQHGRARIGSGAANRPQTRRLRPNALCAVPLSPGAAQELRQLLAGLGVTRVLYSALAAMAQTNLRRMLAYASTSIRLFVLLIIHNTNCVGK